MGRNLRLEGKKSQMFLHFLCSLMILRGDPLIECSWILRLRLHSIDGVKKSKKKYNRNIKWSTDFFHGSLKSLPFNNSQSLLSDLLLDDETFIYRTRGLFLSWREGKYDDIMKTHIKYWSIEIGMLRYYHSVTNTPLPIRVGQVQFSTVISLS
jgi:hypothetical protein